MLILGMFPNQSVPTYHRARFATHLRIQPTNGSIKVAKCASEKCGDTLNEVSISLGKLVVPMDSLVLE